MSDLRELYQEVILDHHKKPRNFRKQAGVAQVEGYNPFCGDRLTVYLKMDGEVIKDVSFEGSGCAISTASASMMTESLKGKTREEAEVIFKAFHDLLTNPAPAANNAAHLGKLAVFSGVREFPVRVKCATLAWHAFHAALDNKNKIVSTE
ncbi:MAG: SUF system NifU family Fe-S cluster assembly protein [Planctomycetota bacterium]